MISDMTLTTIAVRLPPTPSASSGPRLIPLHLICPVLKNSLGVVAMGLIVGYHVLEVNHADEADK
jgi:hypothetical protein